jgi:hypothetical protein
VDCDAAAAAELLRPAGAGASHDAGKRRRFIVTPALEFRRGRRLALQLLEADRVSNPNNTANTATLIDGIEVDEDTGEALACQVSRSIRATRGSRGNTWTRVPFRGATGRRNVLHLFKPLRPGQVRGVPWIAPVLEPLKQLQRFTDAELKAAVDSAIFSVFIKMDPDAFQDLFDEGRAGRDRRQRQPVVRRDGVGQGGEPAARRGDPSPTPGRPNPAFDPFVQAILKQIGVALQLPYEVLTMHYQSSYSAARAALLMAWKFFRARRDWLATYMCQPVYELWLAEEVAEGRIARPASSRTRHARGLVRRCVDRRRPGLDRSAEGSHGRGEAREPGHQHAGGREHPARRRWQSERVLGRDAGLEARTGSACVRSQRRARLGLSMPSASPLPLRPPVPPTAPSMWDPAPPQPCREPRHGAAPTGEKASALTRRDHRDGADPGHEHRGTPLR